MQELAAKFLPHSETSAQVLGLYGMGGFGKTTMSMSLCNRFRNESLRVCFIDIKDEIKALERQQLVMRKLLNLDNRLVQDVRHLAQVKFVSHKSRTYVFFSNYMYDLRLSCGAIQRYILCEDVA